MRGRVQGVGLRPAVWRCARDLGLDGEVLNDAEGVLIRVRGDAARLEALIARIEREQPPLARIEAIERRSYGGALGPGFRIAETMDGPARTQVAPDARICEACAAEILSPVGRRAGYAFANCTHCGPRLSIIQAIPYARAGTTMAGFALCADCAAEHADPADRRFHAEAIACPVCGPALMLTRLDDAPLEPEMAGQDPIGAAKSLIRRGEILAVKGLGGFQLACDATDPKALERLRRLKRRDAKPFALMAADLDVVRRYCRVGPAEERELTGVRGPIVLMPADGPQALPEAVAPGLATLGFMLPTTPLHLMLLDGLDRPLVMTSGNLADEPQAILDEDARRRLGAIAGYALVHDRPIANRVDDSVARMMGGRARVIRRARGYAPEPIALPPGFEAAPPILAMGAELKATFCLLKDGGAVLSQHQGDLEHEAAYDDYRRNLGLYARLFDHVPAALACDRHPEYLSAKLARARADAEGLPLAEIQHHHAHVASCLAETGYPLHGAPVLGVTLDGLGWGEDGTIWGGELLLADYRGFARLARLKPVAMPGGAQAVREPWRNLWAHLDAAFGARATPLLASLDGRPLQALAAMRSRGLNAPLASSCGRLFDAVAAAIGVAAGRQAFEGEAAMRLESLAERAHAKGDDPGYPFAFKAGADGDPASLDPAPMWSALLEELACGTPAPLIAARFHRGLARALAKAARTLARPSDANRPRFTTVVLSGGCFQNRLLFEDVSDQLLAAGFEVRAHAEVPANDGGLALGQAAIAAARLIEGARPCAWESPARS